MNRRRSFWGHTGKALALTISLGSTVGIQVDNTVKVTLLQCPLRHT